MEGKVSIYVSVHTGSDIPPYRSSKHLIIFFHNSNGMIKTWHKHTQYQKPATTAKFAKLQHVCPLVRRFVVYFQQGRRVGALIFLTKIIAKLKIKRRQHDQTTTRQTRI